MNVVDVAEGGWDPKIDSVEGIVIGFGILLTVLLLLLLLLLLLFPPSVLRGFVDSDRACLNDG